MCKSIKDYKSLIDLLPKYNYSFYAFDYQKRMNKIRKEKFENTYNEAIIAIKKGEYVCLKPR